MPSASEPCISPNQMLRCSPDERFRRSVPGYGSCTAPGIFMPGWHAFSERGTDPTNEKSLTRLSQPLIPSSRMSGINLTPFGYTGDMQPVGDLRSGSLHRAAGKLAALRQRPPQPMSRGISTYAGVVLVGLLALLFYS